jgi:hypothetical protein
MRGGNEKLERGSRREGQVSRQKEGDALLMFYRVPPPSNFVPGSTEEASKCGT